MVKDLSDIKKGNPLPPHGLLFPIGSNGSFICTIPKKDSTYHSRCYASHVAHFGVTEKKSKKQKQIQKKQHAKKRKEEKRKNERNKVEFTSRCGQHRIILRLTLCQHNQYNPTRISNTVDRGRIFREPRYCCLYQVTPESRLITKQHHQATSHHSPCQRCSLCSCNIHYSQLTILSVYIFRRKEGRKCFI